MESIKENELLSGICEEFGIKLPSNFITKKTYEEIESFRDFEYTYCIAYEMLRRTDEYRSLISQYDILTDKANATSQGEKIAELDNLVVQMNQLGLNRNSFFGFDCGEGNVFENIRLYEEIINSPWSVRTLDKFILSSNDEFENALDKLIFFYYERKELYILENKKTSKKKYIKTNIHPRASFGIDRHIFIPCIDQDTNKTTYKSLADEIYLKELDIDFLSSIEEKNDKNILKQIKLDYKITTDYWYRYTLGDIKHGVALLAKYYFDNQKIQRADNTNQSEITDSEILLKPLDFLVPSIDRLSSSNGYKMTQVSENLSLRLLEDEFLSTLEFADIKNKYVETEPVFSRPRLLLDEARPINLPINFNLSKEELLFYVSKIKDEYDKDKNIVKDQIEYFFDITLEGEFAEMPSNIQHSGKNSKSKRLFPIERKKFKKNLASAFYIYDLYHFFAPLFEKKTNDINNQKNKKVSELNKKYLYAKDSSGKNDEIKDLQEVTKNNLRNYEINNLITQISYLLANISEEQVEYYLATMKEFIHGVNSRGENCRLKKANNPKKIEALRPKYKNLIIGDSCIMRSNKRDLIRNLIN